VLRGSIQLSKMHWFLRCTFIYKYLLISGELGDGISTRTKIYCMYVCMYIMAYVVETHTILLSVHQWQKWMTKNTHGEAFVSEATAVGH
jgi:hypothetical protein